MAKKAKKSMSLANLIDKYNRDRELAPCYVQTLRCSVRRLGRYLSREATVGDLRYQTINEWLQAECDAGTLKARTRAGGRTDILTLWKYSGRKLKKEKVRKVKIPKRNPEAWTFEQLDSVAKASEGFVGQLPNGVPRSLYFRTIFYFAYETGLRRRDIWSFDFETFAEQRSAVTQHKTGNVHVIDVTDETMQDLDTIYQTLVAADDPNAATPLRWPGSESQFYYWAKKLRIAAGIDADTHNRVLQHSRRTGATDVALAGGAAWQYLGHTQPGLDRKSYVDAVKTAKITLPTRTRANGRDKDRTQESFENNKQAHGTDTAAECEKPVSSDRKRDQT